jgi:glycosyltransferase involved in cell wall biosynthesis
MRPLFCQVTDWWNWYYIKKQISPHFFYYPIQLMIEKGYDVEILTGLHPERREVNYERSRNVEIYRFHKNWRMSLWIQLFSHLMKHQYSLIHLHSLDPVGEHITWAVSRIKTVPMVFTAHSSHNIPLVPETPRPLSLMRKRASFVGDSAKCVFVAFTRTQAEGYGRLGIENVRVIPHGVDPAAFQIERDRETARKYGLEEFNILCVGTYHSGKGQHILVRSMPRILKEHPHTRLLLVGRAYSGSDQEYLETLKSEVRRLELTDKVAFVIDPSTIDLVQLYLSSSLLALPTEAEAFPLVFLEAMAAGLPVVSTEMPHLREILGDGEAGILVDRDQKSVEDAMLTLLNDSELRKRLGESGRSLVQERYRLDKVIQQYWDLYKSLLGQTV